MHLSRWIALSALLAATACTARGGGGGGGGGGGDNDAGLSDSGSAANETGAPGEDVQSVGPDAMSKVDVPTPPPEDVPEGPRCGDGTCNGAETCESCRADCAAQCPPPPDSGQPPSCGDGTCNGSETCMTCPGDCGACAPRCGDGTCNGGETCSTCAMDCGACAPRCGDNTCNGGETCTTCPMDCGACAARCGDGTCNGTETCTTCAMDCGACTGNPLLDPCPSTVSQGPNRNCGWRRGVTLSCLANRATMVGCTDGTGVGSLCQPSYGACTGDPVIRVCPGTEPCTAAAALMPASGSFDDQCGTCPSAYVTCPSSGQIHVMTGDFDSNQPTQRGTCTPAAR